MSQQTCTGCGQHDPPHKTVCSRCGTPYPAALDGSDTMKPIQSGQVIANRYVVQKMIGKGGMGCIYQVQDNTLGETVALKTLLPEYVQEKVVLERFFNEAKIARGLSHPHIVRVHDIGNAKGMVYISMELLQGRTLRSMLDKVRPGNRIPLNAILRMFDALCAALDYAHQYTIHRDIKPENVMVLPDGTIKLMDFGISKLMSNPNLTSASMVMGTPHYMSPEQLKNSANVDARADIYSVGVMLYESLTGDIPTGISRGGTDTLREVPAAIDPIIAKCCQRDPEKRFKTAGDLRVALRAIRKQIETQGPDPEVSMAKREVEPKTRSPYLRKLASILLLGVLGAGGYVLWNVAESRREARVVALPPTSVLSIDTDSVSVSSSVAEVAPDTFARMKPIVERVINKTSSMLLTLEGSEDFAGANHQFELATDHWNLALEAEQSDSAHAMSEGWLALHRYAGLLMEYEGMTFIPPGTTSVFMQGRDQTISVPGFFIDTREVSADDFREFQRSEQWRWPMGVKPGLAPMNNVTYYDAIAYLDAQPIPLVLPELAQWSRALDLRRAPEVPGDESVSNTPTLPSVTWFGGPLQEFTQSTFAGETAEHWIGREVPVVTMLVADSGDVQPREATGILYESISPGVAFRGVWEIPSTLGDLEKFLH